MPIIKYNPSSTGSQIIVGEETPPVAEAPSWIIPLLLVGGIVTLAAIIKMIKR